MACHRFEEKQALRCSFFDSRGVFHWISDGFVFTREEIEAAANESLADIPAASDANGIFKYSQAIEEGFQSALTKLFNVPECSIRTQDLTSSLHRASRKRIFKIGQCLG